MKVHAAFESASSQLAHQPTTGIFFINVRRHMHYPGPSQRHVYLAPCRITSKNLLLLLLRRHGVCWHSNILARYVYIVHFTLTFGVSLCLCGVQLSKAQAQEAAATVNSLKDSGAAFCISMHQQLDQAMLACDMLPTAPASRVPAAANDYVTKLPQLLSLSRLNLTRKSK